MLFSKLRGSACLASLSGLILSALAAPMMATGLDIGPEGQVAVVDRPSVQLSADPAPQKRPSP